MLKYFHSVKLNQEKCKGCTNCIKHCPTEAIRVRDGKAQIIEERCIDCGECIRICPNNAKTADVDTLQKLKEYKYNIALPAPSLYGQFKKENPSDIDSALLALGFDDVLEVAYAAELVTLAIAEYIRRGSWQKPLISQACPAVVGLIQVRFPSLVENIIPIEAPMVIASKIAKEKARKELGIKIEEIGTFFISPCAAKATVIRQPKSDSPFKVDGVLAINEIYGELLKLVKTEKKMTFPNMLERNHSQGIGWGKSGGEIAALGTSGTLAVDGIHNVINLLEEVERGELNNLLYLECQSCAGGCVGGPLAVRNPFVAKVRLEEIIKDGQTGLNTHLNSHFMTDYTRGYYALKDLPKTRNLSPLDSNLNMAIKKMELLEQKVQILPGLDCGSCGSPTCRALAEDIVRGLAFETDCTFVLREKVQVLAEEVLELAKKVPPVMVKADSKQEE